MGFVALSTTLVLSIWHWYQLSLYIMYYVVTVESFNFVIVDFGVFTYSRKTFLRTIDFWIVLCMYKPLQYSRNFTFVVIGIPCLACQSHS